MAFLSPPELCSLSEEVSRLQNKRERWRWLCLFTLLISMLLLFSWGVVSIIALEFIEIPELLAVPILGVMFLGCWGDMRNEEMLKNCLARLKKMEEHEADLVKVRCLLSGEGSFALYLRNFSYGRHEESKTLIEGGITGIANPMLWPKTFGDPNISYLFDKLSNIELVMLANSGDRTVIKNILTVYVDDHSWKTHIMELIDAALHVVVDFRAENLKVIAEFSKNVQFELDYLIDQNRRNIVLLDTLRGRDRIFHFYPALQPLVSQFLEIAPDDV